MDNKANQFMFGFVLGTTLGVAVMMLAYYTLAI